MSASPGGSGECTRYASIDRQLSLHALMDLRMPGLSGVEATRRLAAEAPDVRILVLTMYDDDDESVLAAMRAGAQGYLVKGSPGKRIGGAVRAVAAGRDVSNIFTKMQVADRAQAIVRAREAGLGGDAGQANFVDTRRRTRRALAVVPSVAARRRHIAYGADRTWSSQPPLNPYPTLYADTRSCRVSGVSSNTPRTHTR
jgi:CheY-like chemotaxis protein